MAQQSVVLATAGYDHTIRFWEATTGQCYRTIQYAESVSALCCTLAFPKTRGKIRFKPLLCGVGDALFLAVCEPMYDWQPFDLCA